MQVLAFGMGLYYPASLSATIQLAAEQMWSSTNTALPDLSALNSDRVASQTITTVEGQRYRGTCRAICVLYSHHNHPVRCQLTTKARIHGTSASNPVRKEH